MIGKTPTILIENNTGADVPVKLLQYAGIPNSINATTQYRWDITAETFLAATVLSIQVRTSVTAAYQTYTAPLSPASAQGVVNALNGLNLGTSWYTFESGGNTYIGTDNDTLIFGDLVISDPQGYNLEIQCVMDFAGGSFTLRANGNIIYDTVSPVHDLSINMEISPGIVFDLTGNAPFVNPFIEPIHVFVFKNTSSGLEQIIFQSLSPGDPFSDQFTSEADALSYIVAVIKF
jgi:hypothetical protein